MVDWSKGGLREDGVGDHGLGVGVNDGVDGGVGLVGCRVDVALCVALGGVGVYWGGVGDVVVD